MTLYNINVYTITCQLLQNYNLKAHSVFVDILLSWPLCFCPPGRPLHSCWETLCLVASPASIRPSRSLWVCSPLPCAVHIWSSQRTSVTFAKVRPNSRQLRMQPYSHTYTLHAHHSPVKPSSSWLKTSKIRIDFLEVSLIKHASININNSSS